MSGEVLANDHGNRPTCQMCGAPVWQVRPPADRLGTCADVYDDSEVKRLRAACITAEHEVQQILGKALGYPMLDASVCEMPLPDGADPGVCVGDHTAASLADEAAARIARLAAEISNAEYEIGQHEAAANSQRAEIERLREGRAEVDEMANLLVADANRERNAALRRAERAEATIAHMCARSAAGALAEQLAAALSALNVERVP